MIQNIVRGGVICTTIAVKSFYLAYLLMDIWVLKQLNKIRKFKQGH